MNSRHESSRQSQATTPAASVPGAPNARTASRGALRRAGDYDQQLALLEGGAGPSTLATPSASPGAASGARQPQPEALPPGPWIQEAVDYNLRAHSVSMLVSIREFLIKSGQLAGAAPAVGQVDVDPSAIVDEAFVQAVLAYQELAQLADPDGKIGPGTFKVFQEQGFSYSLQGGAQPAEVLDAEGGVQPRAIVPPGASDAQVYDHFRQVILDNKGVFFEKPGYVNVVGVRGGQYDQEQGTVHQVENTFNQWNDTLIVLQVDAEGNKQVSYYESTVDPGVAGSDVATLPEGTYAYTLGEHAPRSGAYPALNPAYDGYTPAIRGGNSYLGTEAPGDKGAQWINLHTTHGWDQGALDGPGAYSEGCSVVNGQDRYDDFIERMQQASRDQAQGGPGQTIIYYTLLSASRIGGVVLDSQKSVPPSE